MFPVNLQVKIGTGRLYFILSVFLPSFCSDLRWWSKVFFHLIMNENMLEKNKKKKSEYSRLPPCKRRGAGASIDLVYSMSLCVWRLPTGGWCRPHHPQVRNIRRHSKSTNSTLLVKMQIRFLKSHLGHVWGILNKP